MGALLSEQVKALGRITPTGAGLCWGTSKRASSQTPYDSAARNMLWVARFGSTFPAGLTEPPMCIAAAFPGASRRCASGPPFPLVFLMLEALRDFRRRNCFLPPCAQQIEGSLMHQAVVAQTPEGKLRAWVE